MSRTFKQGDKISAKRFHVSKLNVRAALPFGQSESDKALIKQVKEGKIVQPFKVRSESDGYGVYTGRRRFLAKLASGTKEFILGQDFLIEDVNETEGKEMSLVENLDILREDMDAITRAKAFDEIVKKSGLRETARRLGISPSTLSDWLQVLELSRKMQEALSKGLIFYSDALQIIRMKVPLETQDKLAAVLIEQGMDAFKKELDRLAEGKQKRGLPKGKYQVLRTMFDRSNKEDAAVLEGLEKLAKKAGMDIDVYAKQVMADHVKSQL